MATPPGNSCRLANRTLTFPSVRPFKFILDLCAAVVTAGAMKALNGGAHESCNPRPTSTVEASSLLSAWRGGQLLLSAQRCSSRDLAGFTFESQSAGGNYSSFFITTDVFLTICHDGFVGAQTFREEGYVDGCASSELDRWPQPRVFRLPGSVLLPAARARHRVVGGC